MDKGAPGPGPVGVGSYPAGVLIGRGTSGARCARRLASKLVALGVGRGLAVAKALVNHNNKGLNSCC